MEATEKATVFRAIHRYARMSPYKVRLDIDLVRGQDVVKALETLEFSRRRGAKLIHKVLRSAAANAQQRIDDDGLELDVETLIVSDARVDEGPKQKRWRPRARGAAYPIYRRTCHIAIGLTPKPAEEEAKDGSSRKKGKKG